MILLTGACDMDCHDCVFGGLLKRRHMRLGIVDNIASGVEQTDTIILAGGEPTLHPKFFDVVRRLAKNNPVKILVISNGKSFTASQAAADEFARKLKEAAGNTPITLAMSVDEHHEPFASFTKDGTATQEALKERARMFREAC